MEIVRHLAYCIYFLQGTCTKGESCKYRHNEAAKANPITCRNWPQCMNYNCPFKHPFMPGFPNGGPSLKVSSDPKSIECKYFKIGKCTKGDACPFKHTPPSPSTSATSVPNTTVTAETTQSQEIQQLQNQILQLQQQTQQQQQQIQQQQQQIKQQQQQQQSSVVKKDNVLNLFKNSLKRGSAEVSSSSAKSKGASDALPPRKREKVQKESPAGNYQTSKFGVKMYVGPQEPKKSQEQEKQPQPSSEAGQSGEQGYVLSKFGVRMAVPSQKPAAPPAQIEPPKIVETVPLDDKSAEESLNENMTNVDSIGNVLKSVEVNNNNENVVEIAENNSTVENVNWTENVENVINEGEQVPQDNQGLDYMDAINALDPDQLDEILSQIANETKTN